MIRIILIIFILTILNNCSLSKNSQIWNSGKNEKKKNSSIVKIFDGQELLIKELNPEIRIDFSNLKTNNSMDMNLNNFGSLSYSGKLNKVKTYNFKKFDEFNGFDLKPIFLNDSLIFFDQKGTIIKYDNNGKVLWKNNYYTKSEKKLSPKLSFAVRDKNLLIVDNIRKVYSINLETGKLNWSKINQYPFNSEIKVFDNKFFAIDYNNILRCFNVYDGSKCWSLVTENSFTIPNNKYSLIIVNDLVIFSNSIGDITATDIFSGLIVWQLPTQSSNIINQTYNFKTSKLVSDGKSLFFSNNRNEFYSVDIRTGSVNWKNKINSNITPLIIDNFIFTISNSGFLFTVQKNQGNIIRINDLYKNKKKENKKDFKFTGFLIGKDKVYLSNKGKLTIVSLTNGKIEKTVKIARREISRPYIFKNNLYLIKNGQIIRYD